MVRRHRRTMAELLAVGTCVALAIAIASRYAGQDRRDRETELRDEYRGMVRALLLPLPGDLPDSARERGMLFEHLSKTIESVSPNVVRDPKMAPDLARSLLLPLPGDLPDSARERGMLFEHLSKTIESVSPNVVRDPKMAPDLAEALLKAADLR